MNKLTEACEKWASQVVELHAVDVEKIIRAFIDEVEKRVDDRRNEKVVQATFRAFYELKGELLGFTVSRADSPPEVQK